MLKYVAFLFMLHSVSAQGGDQAPDQAPIEQAESVEADAPDERTKSTTAQSGLPLPRFVSLKASKANLHRGPAQNSEIEWVYVKKNMPLEIIAELDYWRQVRDYQGTTGWMHKVLLSSKRRYVLVEKNPVTLRKTIHNDSPVIATLDPGVIAQLLECKGSVCMLDIEGLRGWAPRASLFGVYPNEEVIK